MNSQRQILVVEDEPLLRDIIVSLLRENHMSVVEASNGEDALILLDQQKFSLVLSDISMPNMSGLELFTIATVKKIDVPFVFLTAFGDVENIMKALRLGAFDFIKKPFEEEVMLSVVAKALDIGARRSEIHDAIERSGSETAKTVERNENMIRLLRLTNDKKRVS